MTLPQFVFSRTVLRPAMAFAPLLAAVFTLAPLAGVAQDSADPQSADESMEPVSVAVTPGQTVFPEGTPTLEERLALEPVAGSLGVFAREGADTRVELYPCADTPEDLCGRIVWLRRLAEADGSIRLDVKNPDPALQDRPLIGLEVLTGLSAKNRDQLVWTGGRIYNPDDGNEYRARLAFEGEATIELKACVLILCETQVWQQHSTTADGTVPDGGLAQNPQDADTQNTAAQNAAPVAPTGEDDTAKPRE